jgi:hypothetical protein
LSTAPRRHMGECRYSSSINNSTRWRSVVSFMPLPLYTHWNSRWWYLLYRRLGGLQTWAGHYWDNLLPLPGIEQLLSHPACSLDDILYTGALLATCFQTGLLLGLFFDPEDGGDMFLWKCWLTFNGLYSIIVAILT